VFRLVGKGASPALPQQSLTVIPTRTISVYRGGGVGIELQWITPTLPYDLTKMAEPMTYLSWRANATDGKSHQVAIEVESSGMIAAGNGDDLVGTDAKMIGQHQVLSVETKTQRVLQRKGDGTTIDWGRFYMAAPKNELGAWTFILLG
jgi:hypothetical protein